MGPPVASNGASGLRVENLAKALDISKSGFYCHFKNKEDLLYYALADKLKDLEKDTEITDQIKFYAKEALKRFS